MKSIEEGNRSSAHDDGGVVRLVETEGRLVLTMVAQCMGEDINISFFGGNIPHIGAVALAQPRRSLQGDGVSATCSVLAVCSHKEDQLARHVALSLAARLNTLVSVACGIHLQAASPKEIEQTFLAAERLLDTMAHCLGAEGKSFPQDA